MKMFFTVCDSDVGERHYRREYVESLQKQYMELKQRIYELADQTGSCPVHIVYKEKE